MMLTAVLMRSGSKIFADLVSRTTSATRSDGGTAQAAYRMTTAGAIVEGINGTFNTIHTWLKSGSGVDYEVQMTMQSGDNFTQSTGVLGNWTAMPSGSAITWSVSDSVVDGSSVLGRGKLRVRRASDQQLLDTAIVILSAERTA